MATQFGADDGNDANDATTFANRVKNINTGITAARTAPGDIIRWMGSRRGNIGSQTWTNGSRQITGTMPITVITQCDSTSGWTAATDVTISATTTRREGTNAIAAVIGTPFTTGRMFSFDLGADTDLSAYQQLNFWIQSSATLGTGVLRVDVCSDSGGATPIYSFQLDSSVGMSAGVSASNTWFSVVHDRGSALPTNVRSIAFTALTDPGAGTMRVDNIFVSKAPSATDCLTLHTVVSKSNTVADYTSKTGENLYAIKFINATTIELDSGGHATLPGAGVLYRGTTETVTTYTVQATPVPTPGTSATSAAQPVQESGTAAAMSLYSGGWDRTAMTTQDGITVWKSASGLGRFLGDPSAAKDYYNAEWFVAVGFSSFYSRGAHITVTDCAAVNNAGTAFETDNSTGETDGEFLRCKASWGATAAFSILGATGQGFTIKDCTADGNIGGSNSGMVIANQNTTLYGCTVKNWTGYAAYTFNPGASNPNYDKWNMIDCEADSLCQSGVRLVANCGFISAKNCLISCATEVIWGSTGVAAFPADRFWSVKHDQTAGNDKLFAQGWTVTRQASTVMDGATAFEIKPTSALLTALDPGKFKVGEVYLTASVAKTISVQLRRTNTGLTLGVLVPKHQLDGLSSDTITPMTLAANTTETVSVTVTATESGVVGVWVYYYGGTTFSGFVDGPLTAT